MRSHQRWLPLLACALMTACGTTVSAPPGAAPATNGSFDAGLDAAAPGSELGTGGGTTEAGPGAPVSTGSLGDGSAGALAGAGDAASGDAAAEAEGGESAPRPGGQTTPSGGTAAKAGTVKVGVIIPVGNAGRFLGVDAADTPPEQAEREFNALAEQINARGGFGGHRVQLVFRHQDRTDESEATMTRLQNENCVHLTEDAKVDFVIAAAAASTIYANDCYAKHKVPLFTTTAGSEDDWRRNSPWLMPGLGLNTARMARLMPEAFAARGFLTQKMGIVAFERTLEMDLTKRYLKPGIESRGGKVLEVAYIPLAYNDVAAATASAVLKFKGLGIDRVVLMAPGGGELGVFANQAESQGYRPRYGISTLDNPDFASTIVASKGQLVGAFGPGTLPAVDVGAGERPPTTAKGKECWRFLNEETGSNYATQDIMGIYALARCEIMYSAEAGWRAMEGRSVDKAAVQSSFFAIGRSYESLLFPTLWFRAGAADTVSVYRPIVWSEARGVFTYDGGYVQITV